MLIVDPCSAGEALRIAPYVALVRDHHPDAEITLVANEDALQTLERVEGLDCVVTSNLYRYRPYSRVRIRMCQVRTWLGLMWRLGIGYDLVITFYWGGVLQHLLGYVASRGRRVGHAHYSRLLSRWLLSCSLGPFEWDASHPPQHAALLRAAGLDVGEFVRPSIRHTDEDTIAISQLLQEHHVAVERLIVLHPGSDWACQQWFSACWAELADELVLRYRADVVFTGTASEAAYIEDIRHLMARLSVSLAGQTTLPQLAMLLRSAWLCICVDSAIFELTQATSTPAVVLAGPSRPETGIYGARQPIVIRRMSDQLAGTIVACQGRHNALNETGCWNYHCPMAGLRTIQVADVLAAVACQIQAG